MYETSSVSESNTSWDSTSSNFLLTEYPLSIRGGRYYDGQHAGVCAFSDHDGGAGYNLSWRASLTLFM